MSNVRESDKCIHEIHNEKLQQLLNQLKQKNKDLEDVLTYYRGCEELIKTLEQQLKDAVEILKEVYDTHERCYQNPHNRPTISNGAMDKTQAYLKKMDGEV